MVVWKFSLLLCAPYQVRLELSNRNWGMW